MPRSRKHKIFYVFYTLYCSRFVIMASNSEIDCRTAEKGRRVFPLIIPHKNCNSILKRLSDSLRNTATPFASAQVLTVQVESICRSFGHYIGMNYCRSLFMPMTSFSIRILPFCSVRDERRRVGQKRRYVKRRALFSESN